MKVASNISWQKLINTIFVINEENDSIIKLEDTAGLIWMKVSKGNNVNQIANEIYEEYDVEFKQAQKDVAEFIEYLIAAHLMEK